VGASGPHDFAVRRSITRPRAFARADAAASTASRLNVRHAAYAPLARRDSVNVRWVGGVSQATCPRQINTTGSSRMADMCNLPGRANQLEGMTNSKSQVLSHLLEGLS